jgi:hypothetical protein
MNQTAVKPQNKHNLKLNPHGFTMQEGVLRESTTNA